MDLPININEVAFVTLLFIEFGFIGVLWSIANAIKMSKE